MSDRLRGELRLPGDKSMSHRALLYAALADGETLVVALATATMCAPPQASLPRSALLFPAKRLSLVMPRALRAGACALADVLRCALPQHHLIAATQAPRCDSARAS